MGLPLDTNLGVFISEEIEADVQTTDRHGFQIGQQLDFAETFLLSYGFRYEKTRTIRTDPTRSGGEEERLSLAPLNVTLSRDTRDNFIDATSGWFTSHALDYATPKLGSESAFLRYFGQTFRYFPLSAPRPVPLSGGRQLKPRFVYAVGARIGLIAGFEGGSVTDPVNGASLVPLSEKFFSGGGTTVRGFRQDTLGPVDANGNPEGGDAVITVNNEIRFPVFNILEGVAFLDAGNVYPRIDAIDLGDLRTSGGFGLRLRTPYFLLRADYGLKLDRREGESEGAFFFSIGQAF